MSIGGDSTVTVRPSADGAEAAPSAPAFKDAEDTSDDAGAEAASDAAPDAAEVSDPDETS